MLTKLNLVSFVNVNDRLIESITVTLTALDIEILPFITNQYFMN